VARDHHGHTLRNPGPYHISDGGPPEIVEVS
jgi:hypothetical protein